MIKHLINHIVFVVDKSGSMGRISTEVVKVFDSQIQYLAKRSQQMDQETRVSVYLFDDDVSCLIWDMDVLRLPSLASYYRVGGNTALIDATMQAIQDLSKTPELYCDHAFLTYVLTDGEENRSTTRYTTLASKFRSLPDNWTVAALVPDDMGVTHAERFGFPPNNIQVWSTTSKGMLEVGETIRRATDNFMTARSQGVRSTNNLFKLDVKNLNQTTVVTKLDKLKTSDYNLFPVHRDAPIKDYVESFTQEPYRPGSAYYLLTKKETIQAYKQICVQEKTTGKVYSGSAARDILGLPNHEVKVAPDTDARYDIFIQSTSVNRKLIGGTKVIVLK